MTGEYGDYLPADDEELVDESERIQAFRQKQADRLCAEVAQRYGGFDSNAERIDKAWYNCKFKLWRAKDESSNDVED